MLGIAGTYDGPNNVWTLSKYFIMDEIVSSDGKSPTIKVYRNDDGGASADRVMIHIKNNSAADTLHILYQGSTTYNFTLYSGNESMNIYDTNATSVSAMTIAYLNTVATFTWETES